MTKVFVSSTVLDLLDLRAEVKELLDEQGFNPQLSENADSGFEILSQGSTVETCLANVDSSDYFLLILSKRYGTKTDFNGTKGISVTHLEYREAVSKGKPKFVYVRDRLYGEYKHSKNNPASKIFEWCREENKELFGLIEEAENNNESGGQNWIQIFSTSSDLKKLIRRDLKIASNEMHFEKSILENRVPILNGHAEFKKELSKFPNRFIFHLFFKNFGSVPAYSVEIKNEWEPGIVQKRPVLPPGSAMVKQIVAPMQNNTAEFIGQFTVSYRLIDGNKIEDIFDVVVSYNNKTLESKLEIEIKGKKYIVGAERAFRFEK